MQNLSQTFPKTKAHASERGNQENICKQPDMAKTSLRHFALAGIVGEWCEICSVREQFLLFVCKRLTKTTVSLK